MLSPIKILIAISVVLFVFSACNKQDDNELYNYSISGKVEKGPFLQNGLISVYSVNSNIKNVSAGITDTIFNNIGEYSFNNLNFSNPLIELRAEGKYLSEIYGKNSPGTTNLSCLSNISNLATVNVNCLTDAIVPRIKYLVDSGYVYTEAKEIAEKDFLNFLAVDQIVNKSFESLSIAETGNGNAALLAYSLSLQRYSAYLHDRNQSTLEFNELKDAIAQDFASDGAVNNPALLDTLLHNIKMINPQACKAYLENHYAVNKYNFEIPEFEPFLTNFRKALETRNIKEIFYPDSANIDNSKLENLLNLDNNSLDVGKQYVLAAFVPFGQSLRINFKSDNTAFNYNVLASQGWNIESNNSQGFTISANSYNEIISLGIKLNFSGSAEIEYFENSSEITHQRTIYW